MGHCIDSVRLPRATYLTFHITETNRPNQLGLMRYPLLLLLPCIDALTFGTLDTKIIPLSCPTFRKDAKGFVYIFQPSKIIVCCDESCKLHYFMQNKDNITRCIWSTSMNQQSKSVVFKGMRSWYERVSQRDLMSCLKELDDIDAWDESEGDL